MMLPRSSGSDHVNTTFEPTSEVVTGYGFSGTIIVSMYVMSEYSPHP
jgi:hypothetical protein